jgi:hypothetical protein
VREQAPPLLAIVAGQPTAEETAAVTVALTALTALAATAVSGVAAAADTSPSTWTDRAALLRAPVRPAPGAWRASALPR